LVFYIKKSGAGRRLVMKKIVIILMAVLLALPSAVLAKDWIAPLGSNPAYPTAWSSSMSEGEKNDFATYVARSVSSFVHQRYEEDVDEQMLIPEVLSQLKEGKSYTLELGAAFMGMNAGSYDHWSIGDYTNRSEPMTGIGFALPVGTRLVYGMVVTKPGAKTGRVCSNVVIDKVELLPAPSQVQVNNDKIIVEPGTTVGPEAVRAVLIGLSIGSGSQAQACEMTYGDDRRCYDDRRHCYDDRGRRHDVRRHDNRRSRYDNRRSRYNDRRHCYDDRGSRHDVRRHDDRRSRYDDRRSRNDDRRHRYDDRGSRHDVGRRDDWRNYDNRDVRVWQPERTRTVVRGREQTATHTRTTVSGTRGYMVNRVTGERVLVNDRGTVTTRTETATRRQEWGSVRSNSNSRGYRPAGNGNRSSYQNGGRDHGR